MKEICIINYASNAAIYGIGTYIKEYIRCLLNTGHKVTRIELGTDSSQKEVFITEKRNERAIHIPYLQYKDIVAYNKAVCHILRLYIVDSTELIFHFQYQQSNSLLKHIKEYYPLSKSILTIHYLYWSARFNGNLTLYKDIIRKLSHKSIKNKYEDVIQNFLEEKEFLKTVDKIVCLSDDTYHLINDLYKINVDKVAIIPNGLTRKSHSFLPKKSTDIRKKYHLGDNEKLILFVGRIDSIKGISPLISCFDKVVTEYPASRLILIGDGNTGNFIKKTKNTYTNITFTSRLDKVSLYEWYQIANIAVFPSYYEECSYVGIEMLMHGIPVVASDGYSVKNMFNDNNAVIAPIECWDKTDRFERNLVNAMLSLLNSEELLTLKKRQALQAYNKFYRLKDMEQKYSTLLDSL